MAESTVNVTTLGSIFKDCKMTMRIFRKDLDREVWRTAVLHFGLERIDGLREVGSET